MVSAWAAQILCQSLSVQHPVGCLSTAPGSRKSSLAHLVICESTLEVGVESLHVFAKLRSACIGEGSNG